MTLFRQLLGREWDDGLVFPSPATSYDVGHYARYLFWIPWNRCLTPELFEDNGEVKREHREGLPCLWFEAPQAANVMLFFHGNAEDIGMSFSFVKHMRDQFKVNVLAIEYPGYGMLKRSQRASEENILKSAETAVHFLYSEIGMRYDNIILFGRSLGSGPACYLASKYPFAGMILVAPFTSIEAAVRDLVARNLGGDHVGLHLSRFFTPRFNNLERIAQFRDGKVMFIHGQQDGLIPYTHTLQLFQACRAAKMMITPAEMNHNANLFCDSGFLAVPAINYFGLPGNSTSTPPTVPQRFFSPGARLTYDDAGKKISLESEETDGFFSCSKILKGSKQHLQAPAPADLYASLGRAPKSATREAGMWGL
mmetsp:Transcript_2533/g.5881  ORF Transcript_2533/g.5881 Transcript_2533/m.5881 type:complete len:366 (+) Transcript_2533:1-1098(+)